MLSKKLKILKKSSIFIYLGLADALAVWYNTSGYLLIERGELMRTDKKGQNEVWLHAKPVSSDVCME